MNILKILSGLLAAVLLADGLVTATWGPGFVRWQRRVMPTWTRPAQNYFLRWPEWLLRLGAAGQAVLGGLWLAWSAAGRRNAEPRRLGSVRAHE